jgi:hypothetical protein
MGTPFYAYTTEGVLRGDFDDAARLSDALEQEREIRVRNLTAQPLRGAPAGPPSAGSIATDDLLVVVTPDDVTTPVHAAWNAISLVVPPFFIEGELPTLPGFDPGRALTRPTGQFVLLGRVRVVLLSAGEPALGEHEFAWVNRYAVERVESALELLFFFPGAAQESRQPPFDPSGPPAPA